MHFVKNLSVMFLSKILSVFFGILAVSIISRLLGPEGKGVYALLLTVPGLLVLFTEMGIGMSNVYFMGHKEYTHSQIASNSLILASFSGLLLATGFLLFILIFQPHSLEGVAFLPLFIVSLTVPFSLIAGYFQSILLGQNRITELSLIGLAQGIIFTLFLTLIALLQIKNPLLSIISAWTTTVGVSAIVFVVLVYQATPITFSFHTRLFKDSLRFGIKGYLANIIGALNYRLDLFLVASFLNIAAVGYYSSSASLAETLWYLPGAVGSLVLAQTPKLATKDANRLTPMICRTTLFVTAIMAIVLFILGKPFVTLLFGSRFLPLLQPLGILLPGVVILSTAKVLGNEIAGRGKPMLNTIAGSIGLVIDVGLNLVFLPTMGIAGGALAATIAYTIESIIIIKNFLGLSQNTLADTLFVKKEDFAFFLKFLRSFRNVPPIETAHDKT